MEISNEFKKNYDLMEDAYDSYRKEISNIPIDDPARKDTLVSKAKESDPVCRNPMLKLGEITVEFTAQQKKAHQRWVQKTKHWKWIQESPFCCRIINKPEGYAGDHKLMNMIYRNALEGKTDWGKFIQKQALDSETPQAVRNRRDFLKEQIIEFMCTRGGEYFVFGSRACHGD